MYFFSAFISPATRLTVTMVVFKLMKLITGLEKIYSLTVTMVVFKSAFSKTVGRGTPV